MVIAFLKLWIEIIESMVKCRVINMNFEWADSDNGA